MTGDRDDDPETPRETRAGVDEGGQLKARHSAGDEVGVGVERKRRCQEYGVRMREAARQTALPWS